MINDKYPEVKSYKLIKSMIDQNKDIERSIELQLREYELEIETIQREIEANRIEREDYDIFSPRSEKKESNSNDIDKGKLTELRKDKELKRHELKKVQKQNEDLNYVLETLSIKENESKSENQSVSLKDQIEFCISIIDMDPQRVKTELEKILNNVPRETLS